MRDYKLLHENPRYYNSHIYIRLILDKITITLKRRFS